MVIEEMGKIMSVLQYAYPKWAQSLSVDESKNMIAIWYEMLGEYDYNVIKASVKAHMAESKFPPSIAEIIEKADFILSGGKNTQMTGQEAWALVRKALKNGIYNAKREYDFLPKEIQSAIGDHYALKAWAEMDMGELETVVQSQFIKSHKVKSEQKMEYDKLPNDVKLMIEQTTKLIGGE